MADGTPEPVPTGTTNMNLSVAQFKLLVRLIQLQREAGERIMRVELDLTRDRIILVDRRIVRREIFS
jgi:hypothetical protein